MKLIAIEGIGPVNARKLHEQGIRTTEALLKRGGAPGGAGSWPPPAGWPKKRLLAGSTART